MKISEVIPALERIKSTRGDLTCVEEEPLGFPAIRYVETKVVPQYRAVRAAGVADA